MDKLCHYHVDLIINIIKRRFIMCSVILTFLLLWNSFFLPFEAVLSGFQCTHIVNIWLRFINIGFTDVNYIVKLLFI